MLIDFCVLQPLQKEIEITAEDDQVFLLKMQSQLNQQVPPGANAVRIELFSFIYIPINH